tara:strand:+ start:6464 stop:6946 length:483 start_codon:yes stop_codon:yes gene_type:complete
VEIVMKNPWAHLAGLAAMSLIPVSFAHAQVAEPSLEQPSQIQVPENTGVIGFDSAIRSFGEVVQGETLRHSYLFLNNGSGPITLAQAFSQTSGVSVMISRAPVEAGAFGEVAVSVDTSDMVGDQYIRIRVNSDAYNAPSTLYLRAHVLPPEEVETENAGE